jgi:hypothetical protein
MMKRAILTMIAVLGLLLAACGEAAPAEEATPTPEVTPEVTPEETPEVTPEPEATPDPGNGAAGDLVAILPDEVDGLELVKEGIASEEFTEEADDEFLEFLVRLGRTPDDVTAATAFGFDMNDGRSVFMFAIRVAGANPDQLREEFRRVMEEDDDDPVDFSEERIGGKDVLVGQEDDEFGESILYIYAMHDVLFMVGASDADLGEAALSQLP